MQIFDIAFDHALEGGFSVLGGEKGEVEVLSDGGRYLAAVDAFAAEDLGEAT